MTTTGATTIYEHMFRSFGLRENPFPVSPDPRFLYSGASYESTLAELMFGIESHRGLLVLTGEAGTGKTTLLRHFLQWLKTRQLSSAYIFHSHLDPAELFEFILRDFGVPVESTKKSDLLAALHRWLHARQAEGDSPVVVIDEAQALSLRTLGELNLLLNLENIHGKLVQIVLAGQPELEDKLRRPESRALRQRIMVRCRLPILSLEETGEYISARERGAGGAGTVFPQETIETIYSYARGIPRIVNLLCEQALIGAYADRHTVVSPANVRRVASEFDLVGAPFLAVGTPPVMEKKFSTVSFAESPTPSEVVASAIEESPVQEVVEIAASSVAAATKLEEKVFEAVAAGQAVPVPVASPIAAEGPRDMSAVSAPAAAEAAPVAEVPPASPEPLSVPVVSAIAVPQTPLPVPPAEHEVYAAVPAEPARQGPALVEISRPQEAAKLSRATVWRKQKFPSAFTLYWRDVAQSFLRDWRQFFASFAPQANAFAGHVPHSAESLRRKVLDPLRSWLQTPVYPRRPSGNADRKSDKHDAGR